MSCSSRKALHIRKAQVQVLQYDPACQIASIAWVQTECQRDSTLKSSASFTSTAFRKLLMMDSLHYRRAPAAPWTSTGDLVRVMIRETPNFGFNTRVHPFQHSWHNMGFNIASSAAQISPMCFFCFFALRSVSSIHFISSCRLFITVF
ncbi:hypothetical protein PM082_021844 [Marasmius tenuissimus]|nr:hypothetical protein PM082_021844 [Marasmius tenuissimus]